MSEAWALIRWSGVSLNMVSVVGVYETYEDAHAERLAAPINVPLHVLPTEYHAAGSALRSDAPPIPISATRSRRRCSVRRSSSHARYRRPTVADGKDAGSAALSHDEALDALNALRSNVVGTQSAGWSNTIYPLVAILNAAGLEQFDPSEEQLRQHLDCYGGAGGFPGHALREPSPGWCKPVGRARPRPRERS